VAFALGFAGGFADAAVVVIEPPPVGGGFAAPVWSPSRPAARPAHREGRSVLRLKVTVATWGTEGAQRTRHTMAAALLTHGEGTARTRTTISGAAETRYGHARTLSRTTILTHVGDPREDDQLVLAAAFLLSEQHGSTP